MALKLTKIIVALLINLLFLITPVGTVLSQRQTCQTNDDCSRPQYCPDGSSFSTSLCVKGQCEGITYAGGSPCFSEDKGCTPGLNCLEDKIKPYKTLGITAVVSIISVLIVLWLKRQKKQA